MTKTTYHIIEVTKGLNVRIYTGHLRNDNLNSMRNLLAYYRAEYPDTYFALEEEVTVTTNTILEF